MKSCSLFAALCVTVGLPLAAQVLPPQGTIPAETVIATVDGKDVTAGEIRTMIQNLGPQYAQMFTQDPKRMVQQLILMRYLAGEGEKAKLAEMSPWKEQLEVSRQNIIAQAMFNHEQDSFPVPNEAIKAYYDANSAQFQQSKIKVIFVAFKAAAPAGGMTVQQAAEQAFKAAHSATDRSEADAKAIASDLVAKLRAGADFAKTEEEHSDDPMLKSKGGDFGVIKQSSPYPEDLKKAVLALKQGEISDPIRQPSGFYIVRVEEKTAQPMDDVLTEIVQALRTKHLTEWFGALQQRFAPDVKSTEFFTQPARALGTASIPNGAPAGAPVR